MLNRRLLVYTSGEVEPVLTFIVKDKETGAGIANAYVYLRDGNHQMLMQLGITDSNGILTLSGLTLEPGEYYFDASASGYEALLLGYLVLVSQIFLTTVIVRYDSLEKYEAQLLIFAAQCCFIWYQIEIFESAMRKK